MAPPQILVPYLNARTVLVYDQNMWRANLACTASACEQKEIFWARGVQNNFGRPTYRWSRAVGGLVRCPCCCSLVQSMDSPKYSVAWWTFLSFTSYDHYIRQKMKKMGTSDCSFSTGFRHALHWMICWSLIYFGGRNWCFRKHFIRHGNFIVLSLTQNQRTLNIYSSI